MGQRFETGQSEKPTGSFDCVYESKNVFEDCSVVGLAFEAHQLQIDDVEILAGLRQELAQQIIHEIRAFDAKCNEALLRSRPRRGSSLAIILSVLGNGLILVARRAS